MSSVINAEKKIIGRFATKVAEKVKNGEKVKIVNADKVVISGDEEEVKADYRQKYERGSRDFGPYYPKRPDKILKRTIKGMLPKSGREELLSNVKTYLGVPEELKDFNEADVKEGKDLKNRNYVKLGEVSKSIGWKPSGEL